MTISSEFDPQTLSEHRAFMQALAVSLLGDGHQAEDVVQETYLAALRHPPRSAETLRSWLSCVVRNIALNVRRGEARRSSREREGARGESVPSTEEISRRIGVERQVSEALLELSEAYRGALYLRFYEDLPPREIASRLGIPVETVRSRLRRGLEVLRSRLDSEYGGDRHSWRLALLPWLPRAAPQSLPLVGVVLCEGVLLALAVLLLFSWLPSSRTRPPSGIVAATRTEHRHVSSPFPSMTEPVKDLASRSPIAIPGEVLPDLVPRASLEGRVLDSRTGEPVPRLDVHLVGPAGVAETVCTGWDGRFASDSVFEYGAVAVRLTQGQPERPVFCRAGALSHHSSDASDAGHELLADIGPTFCIRVALPPDLLHTDLVTRLREPASEGCEISAALLPPCDPTLHCLRFDAMPTRSFMDGGTRSEFVLDFSGGSWTGEARVHAKPGIQLGVIEVELEAAGRVNGQLTDRFGAPVPSVPVVLRSPTGARLRASSNAEGFYSLSPVAEGHWTLQIASDRHALPEQHLVIEGGEGLRCDLVLDSRETTSLQGTLSSRTGDHLPTGAVQLVDASDPTRCFRAEPECTRRDGRTHASFAFQGIPHGTYTLYPPTTDGFAWDPPQLQLELPSPPVFLICRDDVPAHDIGFEVYDQDTGEPIEAFRGVVLVDRYGLGKRDALARAFDDRPLELEFGGVAKQSLPEGLDSWWMIEADGYRAALGDAADFHGQGSLRLAEVYLVRAWRCDLQIYSYDPSGGTEPLAGVDVRTIGGSHLGTSLADGCVYLELGYDPGRLQLQREGWRVHSWEGFWRGRRFRVLDRHFVCMVPE
jgi:RNA polymerase sigma factor (sigma-70 family)